MTKEKVVRDHMFSMKMNTPEREQLDAAAAARGLTAAGLIRLLVADEARRLNIK